MATAQNVATNPRYRALVVDDSQIARYVLSGLLDRLGYEVDLADSAELALRQLSGPLPDVVFMDHLLPGMDGLEAVRRLRAQPRSARLPIVMYTSQDTSEFAARAAEAGADDVFRKSARHEQLGDILNRLGLLPGKSETGAGRGTVVSLHCAGHERPQSAARRSTIRVADIAAAIQPVLASQHDRLRRELLAEFVVLERYEERMRRELFARVDEMSRRTAERVDRSLARRLADGQRQQRAGRRRSFSLAAGVAFVFLASLAAGWSLQQHGENLETRNSDAVAALREETRRLGELGERLEANAEARERANERYTVPTAAATGTVAAALPANGAEALVTELQSMGILGPVRIETAAGSFCVRASGSGLRMEASATALQDCEVLPVYLAEVSPR